jgi:hypothetical protein
MNVGLRSAFERPASEINASSFPFPQKLNILPAFNFLIVWEAVSLTYVCHPSTGVL